MVSTDRNWMLSWVRRGLRRKIPPTSSNAVDSSASPMLPEVSTITARLSVASSRCSFWSGFCQAL